jgi:hypothetical protein
MTTNLQSIVNSKERDKFTVEGGALYTVRPEPTSGRELTSRLVYPCGGGVEYLHRDPASRRRRRKGMSQI